MTARQRIPTEQQKILSEMWAAGATAAKIAVALGITKAAVYTLRWQYKLPRRPRVIPEEINPTADEIAERAAEVRSMWSDDELDRRAVGRCSGWRLPKVRLRL